MGVRQLTTFIKNYVPDGYTDVSIIGECKKFKRVHGRKPEIVIDILGSANLIANFDPDKNEVNENLAKLESLCGGSFPKFQKTCEIFFKKFSEIADLVFFKDGTVRPEKVDSYIRDKDYKYHEMIALIDMIDDGKSLTEIIDNIGNFPRVSTPLGVIKSVAKKYGKFIITRTRECDAEIVKYANENKSFAVLAEDSDFLIFEGEWRYFSLQSFKIADLSTKEFNKRALWSTLGLENLKQKVMLATINGNDFTLFDDLRDFHMQLTNRRNLAQNRFLAIAKYIRVKDFSNKGKMRVIEEVVKLFDPKKRDIARVKIAESIEMYRTNFPLFIPEDPIERFCVDTSNNFVHTIFTKSIKKFKILFFDLRKHNDEFPNLHEAETEVFIKQAGIILKHKNEDIELKMIAKRTHDGSYELRKVKPDYPPFDVPPLIELLSPEEFENHDEVRWKLLRCIVDVCEEITQVPALFVHEILTLNYMRRRGFIEVFEADLVLLTIKMVRDGNYDKAFDKVPEVLNKRAFQLQFLICKFQSFVSNSLKVCGLCRRYEHTDFSGVFFHNLYLKYPTSSENPAVLKMLGDCVPYRLYT